MGEQLALLPSLLTAHVQLVLAALLAGTAIAVPAGILVTRVKRLEAPVLAAAALVQTIPALALLAVMVARRARRCPASSGPRRRCARSRSAARTTG